MNLLVATVLTFQLMTPPLTEDYVPNNSIEVTLVCTYYTNLAIENGTYNGQVLTATGEKLKEGMFACNYLEYGVKVYTKEYGVITKEDCGSPKHFPWISDTEYRIDIFVPREEGESDKQYLKRVNKLGVKEIKGWILPPPKDEVKKFERNEIKRFELIEF